MNQFRTIRCPACVNRNDTVLWCDTCYGSRQIVLRERERPGIALNWKDLLLFFGKVLLLAALAWGLVTGWFLLGHRHSGDKSKPHVPTILFCSKERMFF